MMNAKQRASSKKVFEEVLEFYGNQNTQLARALKIGTSTVDKWKARGQVSFKGAIKIQDAAPQFKAVTLRPDLVIEISVHFMKRIKL